MPSGSGGHAATRNRQLLAAIVPKQGRREESRSARGPVAFVCPQQVHMQVEYALPASGPVSLSMSTQSLQGEVARRILINVCTRAHE